MANSPGSRGACAARTPLLGGLAAAALTLATLAFPKDASACSCDIDFSLTWPEDGATGVSRAPVLVVSNYRDEVPVLRDGSGNEVPLRELPPEAALSDNEGCGWPELFEPLEPLLANHTYTIGVEGEPEPDSEAPATFTFTTGEESPPPPAPPSVELRFYRVIPEPGCTGRSCSPQAHVEVRVTRAAPGEESPSWLVLDGTEAGFPAKEGTGAFSNVTPLWGPYWDGLLGKLDALLETLRLPSDHACVRYRQLDGRGTIVAQGELCTAEKCARLSPEAGEHWNSCSSLNSLSLEGWSRVSEASCSAPPALTVGPSPLDFFELAEEDAGQAQLGDGGTQRDPPHEPVPDEPSAGALAELDAGDDSGCSAGPARTHSSAAWLPLAVVALMSARRRRRRI